MSASTSTEQTNGQQQQPAPKKAQRKHRSKAAIAASQAKANATRAANKLAKAPSPTTAISTIQPTPERAVAMATRASVVSAGAPPPLMLDLIQTLPPIGSAFSQAQQTAWIGAVTSCLGVLYPASAAKAA